MAKSKRPTRPRKRKSWLEKLDSPNPSHGKVVKIPPQMQKSLGQGTLLIPKPRDVAAIMRKPAKGKLITQSEIRRRLARKAGTDQACPLCTGIFIRIVAE